MHVSKFYGQVFQWLILPEIAPLSQSCLKLNKYTSDFCKSLYLYKQDTYLCIGYSSWHVKGKMRGDEPRFPALSVTYPVVDRPPGVTKPCLQRASGCRPVTNSQRVGRSTGFNPF